MYEFDDREYPLVRFKCRGSQEATDWSQAAERLVGLTDRRPRHALLIDFRESDMPGRAQILELARALATDHERVRAGTVAWAYLAPKHLRPGLSLIYSVVPAQLLPPMRVFDSATEAERFLVSALSGVTKAPDSAEEQRVPYAAPPVTAFYLTRATSTVVLESGISLKEAAVLRSHLEGLSAPQVMEAHRIRPGTYRAHVGALLRKTSSDSLMALLQYLYLEALSLAAADTDDPPPSPE